MRICWLILNEDSNFEAYLGVSKALKAKAGRVEINQKVVEVRPFHLHYLVET